MTENNEYINNEIKFLAKSGIRLTILNELKRKPHTIREIVKSTGINYSSVSSNITKLEKANYITKVNKRYQITPLSELYLNTLMEFKQSVDFIVNFEEFWIRHNINQINEESLKNITDLNYSKLVKTTPLDIYKTHNVIKNQLETTKSLKAIFPYMHPDYPKLIENILVMKGCVEIIMPRNFYKTIVTPIDTSLRKEAIAEDRLKICLVDDKLNLDLSICDKNMHLGLFKNDGSFDQNRILTSNHPKSIQWAENLFENIRNVVI